MMSSIILALAASSAAAPAATEAGLECKMIPQADETQSVELCANEKQWKSITAKVGGDIANLRCIFLDKAGSAEPVRACGTKEQIMKKIGATSVDKISDVKCKQITEVGSRIPRKVCLTEAQWEEARRENEGQMARELRNRAGN